MTATDNEPATAEGRLAARRLGQAIGGRWTLERVLGVGGMAAVYAARATDGTLAAVKILHPEIAADREARERFLREGLAANRVDHPGAVRVLDQAKVEDAESPYLVMELLDGECLADRHKRAKLGVEELLDILDQTLDVLGAAHDKGIVHRDLKPDNLFVTRDGRVKVLDFGVARFLESVPDELRTRTGIAIGTLPYMSPEQAFGRRDQIDGRTDLFALGAIMFRLLAGRRVHEADSDVALLVAMATKPAPPLAEVLPSVRKDVAAIVDTALAFDRDARYPDARTMQADVRAVRAGSVPPYVAALLHSRDRATCADGGLNVGAAVAAAAVVRTPTVVAERGRANTPPAGRTPTIKASPASVPAGRTPTVKALPVPPPAGRTPTVKALHVPPPASAIPESANEVVPAVPVALDAARPVAVAAALAPASASAASSSASSGSTTPTAAAAASSVSIAAATTGPSTAPPRRSTFALLALAALLLIATLSGIVYAVNALFRPATDADNGSAEPEPGSSSGSRSQSEAPKGSGEQRRLDEKRLEPRGREDEDDEREERAHGRGKKRKEKH